MKVNDIEQAIFRATAPQTTKKSNLLFEIDNDGNKRAKKALRVQKMARQMKSLVSSGFPIQGRMPHNKSLDVSFLTGTYVTNNPLDHARETIPVRKRQSKRQKILNQIHKER